MLSSRNLFEELSDINHCSENEERSQNQLGDIQSSTPGKNINIQETSITDNATALPIPIFNAITALHSDEYNQKLNEADDLQTPFYPLLPRHLSDEKQHVEFPSHIIIASDTNTSNLVSLNNKLIKGHTTVQINDNNKQNYIPFDEEKIFGASSDENQENEIPSDAEMTSTSISNCVASSDKVSEKYTIDQIDHNESLNNYCSQSTEKYTKIDNPELIADDIDPKDTVADAHMKTSATSTSTDATESDEDPNFMLSQRRADNIFQELLDNLQTSPQKTKCPNITVNSSAATADDTNKHNGMSRSLRDENSSPNLTQVDIQIIQVKNVVIKAQTDIKEDLFSKTDSDIPENDQSQRTIHNKNSEQEFSSRSKEDGNFISKRFKNNAEMSENHDQSIITSKHVGEDCTHISSSEELEQNIIKGINPFQENMPSLSQEHTEDVSHLNQVNELNLVDLGNNSTGNELYLDNFSAHNNIDYSDQILNSDPNFSTSEGHLDSVQGLIQLEEESNLPQDLQEFVFQGSLHSDDVSINDLPAAHNLPVLDNLSMLVDTYLADEENGSLWSSAECNSEYQHLNSYTGLVNGQPPPGQMYMYVPIDQATVNSLNSNSQTNELGVQYFLNHHGQIVTQDQMFPMANNFHSHQIYPGVFPPAGMSSNILYKNFKPRSGKRDSLSAFRRWRIHQQKLQSQESANKDTTNEAEPEGSRDGERTDIVIKAVEKENTLYFDSTTKLNKNNHCLPKEDEVDKVLVNADDEDDEVEKVYVVPAPWLSDSAQVDIHDSEDDPNQIIPKGHPYITVKKQNIKRKEAKQKLSKTNEEDELKNTNSQSSIGSIEGSSVMTNIQNTLANGPVVNSGDQDDCPSVEAMIAFCKQYNRFDPSDSKASKPTCKNKKSSKSSSLSTSRSSSIGNIYTQSPRAVKYPFKVNADLTNLVQHTQGITMDQVHSSIKTSPGDADRYAIHGPIKTISADNLPEGFRLLRVAEHKLANGEIRYIVLDSEQSEDQQVSDTIYKAANENQDNSSPESFTTISDTIKDADSQKTASPNISGTNEMNNIAELSEAPVKFHDVLPKIIVNATTEASGSSTLQTPFKNVSAYHASPNRLAHNLYHLLTPPSTDRGVTQQNMSLIKSPHPSAFKSKPRSKDKCAIKQTSSVTKMILDQSSRSNHPSAYKKRRINLDQHPLIRSPSDGIYIGRAPRTSHTPKIYGGEQNQTKMSSTKALESGNLLINAYTIHNGESSSKNERTTRTIQPDLIKGWYALQDGSGESNHIVLLEENDNLIVLPIEDSDVKKTLAGQKHDTEAIVRSEPNSEETQKSASDVELEKAEPDNNPIRSRLRSAKSNQNSLDIVNALLTDKPKQQFSKKVMSISKAMKAKNSIQVNEYQKLKESLTMSKKIKKPSEKETVCPLLSSQYSDISLSSLNSLRSPPQLDAVQSSSSYCVESVGSRGSISSSCSSHASSSISTKQTYTHHSKTNVYKKLIFSDPDLSRHCSQGLLEPLDLFHVLDPILNISVERACQQYVVLLQIQILKAKELLMDRSQQRVMNHLGQSLYQCISHLASAILSSVSSLHCLMSSSDTKNNSLCKNLHQMLKVNSESLCQMIPQYVLVLSSQEEAILIQDFFKDSKENSPEISNRCLATGGSQSFTPQIRNVPDTTDIRLIEEQDSSVNQSPTLSSDEHRHKFEENDDTFVKNCDTHMNDAPIQDESRDNNIHIISEKSSGNTSIDSLSSPRLSTVAEDSMQHDSISDDLELCGGLPSGSENSLIAEKGDTTTDNIPSISSETSPQNDAVTHISSLNIENSLQDDAIVYFSTSNDSFHPQHFDTHSNYSCQSSVSRITIASDSETTIPYGSPQNNLSSNHCELSPLINSHNSHEEDARNSMSPMKSNFITKLNSNSATSVSIISVTSDTSICLLEKSDDSDSLPSIPSVLGLRRITPRHKKLEPKGDSTSLEQITSDTETQIRRPRDNVLSEKSGVTNEDNVNKSPTNICSFGKRKRASNENSPECPVLPKTQRSGTKKKQKKKSSKKHKKTKKKWTVKKTFPNLRSMTRNVSTTIGQSDSLTLIASSSEEVIPQTVKRGFQYKEECLAILNTIYNNRESDYFCHEILSSDDANYYKVIKRGMCFDIIAKKIRQSLYSHLEDYIRDMRLVFSNCRMYHTKGSLLYTSADILEELFEENFKNYFPGCM